MKPRIGAPAPLASITSLSLMPPAPERMIRARTSSVASLSSEPTIASAEPCTSAFTSSGSSETFLSASLAIMSASEPPAPTGARMRSRLQADAIVGELAGAGLVFHHGEGLARIGGPSRPRISTGAGRAGLGHLLVALVEQGAHAARSWRRPRRYRRA